MIKLTPYRTGDLDPERLYVGWDNVASLVATLDPDLSFSFYHQDTYLGSAGIIEASPGVGETWLVLTHRPPCTIEFVRMLRWLLQVVVVQRKLTKLRSFVFTHDPRAKRFAELFGFRTKYTVDAMERVTV